MNNFKKVQTIEGYYFSNYLMNNENNKGETENGRFTISLIDKPASCEIVTWRAKCMIPIKKPFRIAHPAFRNNYFKVNFKFFPPIKRKLPLFYVTLEKMWGIKFDTAWY